MILVSACLAGFNCRYNGGNCCKSEIFELLSKGEAVPVCPEILGGLSTPRNPIEVVRKSSRKTIVLDSKGSNLTEELITGARKCLDIAKLNNVKIAVLKSKSPSCGYGQIYDGSFTGKLIKGNGLTADLLSKHGIKILNEENYKNEPELRCTLQNIQAK